MTRKKPIEELVAEFDRQLAVLIGFSYKRPKQHDGKYLMNENELQEH
jgi:hypothetical protein